MQLPKIALTLVLLMASGCAPGAAPIAALPGDTTDFDILDIQIGQIHPQLKGVSSERAFAGVVAVDLPVLSQPLSSVFHDYSVQLDASSKQVVSLSAARTLASFPECKKHFDSVVSVVKSKYRFDSEKTMGPASLEATIGPVTLQVLCSTGFVSPKLSLYIFDKSLATKAYERSLL